jgi:hypothetical protein
VRRQKGRSRQALRESGAFRASGRDSIDETEFWGQKLQN